MLISRTKSFAAKSLDVDESITFFLRECANLLTGSRLDNLCDHPPCLKEQLGLLDNEYSSVPQVLLGFISGRGVLIFSNTLTLHVLNIILLLDYISNLSKWKCMKCLEKVDLIDVKTIRAYVYRTCIIITLHCSVHGVYIVQATYFRNANDHKLH